MLNPKATPSPLTIDLLLLLVTFLASAGWIFSRETVAEMSPFTFACLRFGGSALLLGFFCAPSLTRLVASHWFAATRVGILFGLAMIFWVLGLKLTHHIGIGAFLISLGLVLVPLVSRLFGDRPGYHVYLALPVALAGLACLLLDKQFTFGPAEVCFLISAVIQAFAYVYNSRAATQIPAVALTAIQLLLAGAITGAAALTFETIQLEYSLDIWAWFAAAVLLATCLRFALLTRIQGLAPPSHSAIFMVLEPVWTAILALTWLGEKLSLLQLLGCGLIFSAVLVNRWPTIRYWLKRK